MTLYLAALAKLISPGQSYKQRFTDGTVNTITIIHAGHMDRITIRKKREDLLSWAANWRGDSKTKCRQLMGPILEL